MYKLLRTSFNYDLGDRAIHSDHVKLRVMMSLLGVYNSDKTLKKKAYMFTPRQISAIQEALSVKIDESILKEVKFATKHTQFLMPPNYNTSVGLRAVIIKLNEDPPSGDDLQIVNPTVKFALALESFQKLYFSLFYWTAMLAKIDKNLLGDIHFMKYPRSDLSATDFLKQLHKRKRNLSLINSYNQTATQQTCLLAKKPKTSEDDD
jgi:hypothetical protein